MLWALVFTVVYFATRDVAIEDSVAADGYIAALLITFIITIFFVIPARPRCFLGNTIDVSTAKMPSWRAGMTFGVAGLLLGTLPAVFIYMVNNAYGWLPFTQLMIPSLLAPWLGRMLLDPAMASIGASASTTLVFTGLIVVFLGSLSIGVSVFTGKI